MTRKRIHFISLHFTWAALWLALTSPSAYGLNEIFELYSAPQSLAIGNAFTADAAGVASLFHNPAGLAKAVKKGWEITPIAVDASIGGSFLGALVSTRTTSIERITQSLTPGAYAYLKANAVPSFTRRNFGIALLGSYEYAALSDGTTVDIRAGNDVGVVIGGSTHFANNILKIGLGAKALLRNQLLGSFSPTALSDATAVSSAMKEGIGLGADLGLMATAPISYLPTFGIVWKDILSTRFMPSRFLNPLASGTPDPIAQSIHLAVSASPAIGKGKRLSISAEFRHLELSDLPLQKRLHFGLQLAVSKRFFLWFGMNQLLLPTGGMATRMPGGDLEIGTNAVDIGAGSVVLPDRRLFMRYTIGF
jgi:hypothetical protein